jgi:hypothetical protein
MEHVRLTDSPKARRLLKSSSSSFMLVRLEPVNLACSVEQTWAPILSRWLKRDRISPAVPVTRHAETTESAGPIIH